MNALIRSTTERDDESGDPLYWSNLYGWCGLASATRYTAEERRAFNLPAGGEWIVAPDAAAFVMLPSPAEDAAPIARTLGQLPVFDPNRQKLRDRVTLSTKQLAVRCRKFMTRTYFDKVPSGVKPVPTYKQWLRLACVPSRLTANPPKYPDVPRDAPEDVINSLATNPYYLAEFCKLNRLLP